MRDVNAEIGYFVLTLLALTVTHLRNYTICITLQPVGKIFHGRKCSFLSLYVCMCVCVSECVCVCVCVCECVCV